MEQFDANKDGKVTWEEFKQAMDVLKDKVNNKSKQAKEYQSFN